MSLKNKTCQPASGVQDSRASLEFYQAVCTFPGRAACFPDCLSPGAMSKQLPLAGGLFFHYNEKPVQCEESKTPETMAETIEIK